MKGSRSITPSPDEGSNKTEVPSEDIPPGPAAFQRRAFQGFQGGNDPDTTAARIAALRPGVSNAVLAPLGTPQTPIALHEAGATLTADSGFIADAQIMVPIIPTVYPSDPTAGTIIVQNYTTIIDRAALEEFNSKMTELCELMRRSNEIAGETRDKLLGEIAAGMALLNAPKPDPKMIQLLLRRPLMYVGEKATGAIIGAVAVAALGLLGKATGLW
jgi:hypothetical protein